MPHRLHVLQGEQRRQGARLVLLPHPAGLQLLWWGGPASQSFRRPAGQAVISHVSQAARQPTGANTDPLSPEGFLAPPVQLRESTLASRAGLAC